MVLRHICPPKQVAFPNLSPYLWKHIFISIGPLMLVLAVILLFAFF